MVHQHARGSKTFYPSVARFWNLNWCCLTRRGQSSYYSIYILTQSKPTRWIFQKSVLMSDHWSVHIGNSINDAWQPLILLTVLFRPPHTSYPHQKQQRVEFQMVPLFKRDDTFFFLFLFLSFNPIKIFPM